MSTWIISPKWWACVPPKLKKVKRKTLLIPAASAAPIATSVISGWHRFCSFPSWSHLEFRPMNLSKGFVPGVRIHCLPRICLGFKVGLIFWKVSLSRGWGEVTEEMDFFSPFCLKMKTHHILQCVSLVKSRNTMPPPRTTLKTTQQSHDNTLSWTSPDFVSFCNIQSNL